MQVSAVTSPSGAHMIIDGRSVLNFGGSSYLGLAGEPALAAAAGHAAAKLGGSCQLPRHYGFMPTSNLAAEEAARRFFGVDGAMYFATGYLFGQLALSALAQDYDVAVLDAHAHYSLRDGASVACKPIITFRHRDPADLKRVIADLVREGKRPLVATDGMFPTFGTVAPLSAYKETLESVDAWLVVDESHAFGAIGPSGGGAVEFEGVRGPRVVAGGSMAKAFCAYGGLAIGAAQTIERLWQAPVARGAVAGCSAGAAMTTAALDFARGHPETRARLEKNTRTLRAALQSLGLNLTDTPSPVAAFELTGAEDMKAVQAGLWRQGIFVIYSNYVGAGPNGALRIAAFADHSSEDFARLQAALKAELEERAALGQPR